MFYRIGPYHFARLKAAGARMRVTAVEFSDVDPVYPWREVPGQDSFDRVTLFPGVSVESQPSERIFSRMNGVLDGLRPAAVALPGWYDRCSLAALRWCALRAVPAVMMSETTSWDESRVWWREWVKRRVVGLCASAFVGGRIHADYMAQLGMPRERIFQGYDAVDNDFFERGAQSARREAGSAERELPERYFLASARFVEKKNLPRLIQAYARYRELSAKRGAQSAEREAPSAERQARSALRLAPCATRTEPWDLVLLGDGPLRGELEARSAECGVRSHVLMPGFKQYPELPFYYGLASAFVHASTTEQWGLVVNEAMASGLPVLVSKRCGCAADLVEEGVNGFTFDPVNVEELAGLMLRLSTMSDARMSGFGIASRELARKWGAPAFARGLEQAVSAALERGPVRPAWVERACLVSLVRGAKTQRPVDARVAGTQRGRQSEHLVFSFRGQNVLAVPRQPPELRRTALKRYQPYTLKRRLYSRFLQTAISLHAEAVVARRGPFLLSRELGFDYEAWLKVLCERLSFPRAHAILAWPSEPSRKRLYVHLLTEELQPLAFVKLATGPADARKFQSEAEALRELGQLGLRRVRVPRVLDQGQYDSTVYLALEPLPSKARPPRWGRSFNASELLMEISSPPERLTGEAITGLSWWQEYARLLKGRDLAFTRELARLLPLGAQVCRAHGDLGLSNLARDGTTIWLFDWESTHAAAPAMADEVSFFLSFSIHKATARREACLRDFEKRFLREASMQRRLDVMLALAFRYSTGVADSEFYMENWPVLAGRVSG